MLKAWAMFQTAILDVITVRVVSWSAQNSAQYLVHRCNSSLCTLIIVLLVWVLVLGYDLTDKKVNNLKIRI